MAFNPFGSAIIFGWTNYLELEWDIFCSIDSVRVENARRNDQRNRVSIRIYPRVPLQAQKSGVLRAPIFFFLLGCAERRVWMVIHVE